MNREYLDDRLLEDLSMLLLNSGHFSLGIMEGETLVDRKNYTFHDNAVIYLTLYVDLNDKEKK